MSMSGRRQGGERRGKDRIDWAGVEERREREGKWRGGRSGRERRVHLQN